MKSGISLTFLWGLSLRELASVVKVCDWRTPDSCGAWRAQQTRKALFTYFSFGRVVLVFLCRCPSFFLPPSAHLSTAMEDTNKLCSFVDPGDDFGSASASDQDSDSSSSFSFSSAKGAFVGNELDTSPPSAQGQTKVQKENESPSSPSSRKHRRRNWNRSSPSSSPNSSDPRYRPTERVHSLGRQPLKKLTEEDKENLFVTKSEKLLANCPGTNLREQETRPPSSPSRSAFDDELSHELASESQEFENGFVDTNSSSGEVELNTSQATFPDGQKGTASVENNTFTLTMKNEQSSTCLSFKVGKKEDYDLCSVVQVGGNKFVASAPHQNCLLLFTIKYVSGSLPTCSWKKINWPFDEPMGMYYCVKKKKLFVCDSKSKKVMVLDHRHRVINANTISIDDEGFVPFAISVSDKTATIYSLAGDPLVHKYNHSP